ncbi:hypothetical protein BE20_24990 [Sorangium cellulosum]|uniref:Uncharacterized protein n=1 Tax=Sorangium cellulosum TaxID=56 RepID=A0A150S5S0_SORCE|nr:hypothetical protein BE20_24990 [Sorangium cellulosum]KYF89261.1 hypothetical protein BE18_22780 [Sorangium cellulosum]
MRTRTLSKLHISPPPLPIACCPDPDKPRECRAIPVITRLHHEDRLPNFTEVFGAPSPDGLGDCHEVSLALMVDLIAAGCSDGWQWVTGTHRMHRPPLLHSWLEFDGWAVDVANGKVLVMEAAMYRSMTKAHGLTRRNAQQTRDHLETLLLAAPRG